MENLELNLKSKIWNLESGIWNLEFRIWNLMFFILKQRNKPESAVLSGFNSIIRIFND